MSARLDRNGRLAVLTYPTPPEILRALTRAELEVARLLADGLSNDEIAALRTASPRTVANQIATLYRKVGARSRRECILRLFGGRLVPIERSTLEVLASLRAPHEAP